MSPKKYPSKSLLLLVSLSLFHSTSIFCQDSSNTINKISISSPTAASLGKYGEIPVSYNSGIPQIAIPLYNIKSKSLTMPISLSYHASGLKVQEMASWVGAGWSLNAGGVITRTVVGVPDDKGPSTNIFTHGHYSDTGFNNYLFIPWTGYGATADGKMADDESFAQGLRDGEPDMFTFNFGGYAGKFYFNDDRTPILVPEQDFKIETDFTLGTGFNGFIVSTPDGSRYYFGKTGNNGPVNPIEMTIPMTFEDGPLLNQRAISSWYLNKVVSADAIDSITFQYQAESYGYYTLSMFAETFYRFSFTGPSSKDGYNLVKNLVDGVRLSQINFLNGTVTFVPSGSPRSDLVKGYPTIINDGQPNTTSYSLGSLQIQTTNSFCKKFNFKYSYFHDVVNGLSGAVLGSGSFSNITSDSYKLKLDTLQELSCDGSIQIPPHIFDYYSGTVARTLSRGLDHWGFYNGVTTNLGLVPTHMVKFNGELTEKPGANRDAAFPAMQGGTLQKITYPTGGYTSFDYEPNTTHVSYNTYSINYHPITMTAGYSGSFPVTEYHSLSGNMYKITLQNGPHNLTPSANSDGSLQIYNVSTGVAVFSSGSVAPESVMPFLIALPAGNYRFVLIRNGGMSNAGVTMWMDEYNTIVVSSNVIVGGLRVKTITTNPAGATMDLVTSYNYNLGGTPTGQSSGILYSRPEYVKMVKNKMNDYVNVPTIPGCQVILASPSAGGLEAYAADQYYKSSSSVRPMQTVQGYHIGYNEVKVSQTNNGYSIYRYYGSNYWDNKLSDVCTRLVNWDDVCDINIPQTPAAPVEFEFMRGELKFEGFYNESGNILKSVWHYPKFTPSLIVTPGHISTHANGIGLYTDYFLRSARKVSDSTEVTMYDPVAYTYMTSTTVEYYTSLYHHQPVQKVSYTSTDARTVRNLSYAFDLLPSSCTSINDGLASYQSSVSIDSTTYSSTLSSCTPQLGVSTCRFPATIQFRRNLSLHRNAYITTRRTNLSAPTNTFQTAHNVAKSAAGTDYKPILELQDQFMNPVIEESVSKDNRLLNASILSYAYSTNPTGEVYPMLNQEINLISPSSTFTKATVNVSNSAITKDSRYTDRANFKFDGGNLVEVTGRDGVPTSYIWDINYTQPVIKAEGVTYSILKTAYTASGNNLITVRNQASLTGALLSTYTYQPLIGVTSETNPSLQKLSYEYDGMFRLVRIRDKDNNILKQYDYKYNAATQ